MKIKTMVIGGRVVGKTTFVQHLNVRSRVHTSYIPTIGIDFTEYSKSGTVLHIWDTSGAVKYREVVRTFMRQTNLFIIMYRDKRSLDKVWQYIHTIRVLANTDARIVIVSNANDLDLEVEGQLRRKRIRIFLRVTA